MPFISVTRLKIRSIRFLPGFALHAQRTSRQVSTAPGLRGGSLMVDRGWVFWTLTAWDSQDAMRAYMTSGSHRTAMPRLLDWCDEASVVHWDEPGSPLPTVLPTWVEADRRMRDEGRPSKVRHPSPQHAEMRYRAPCALFSGPIQPAGSSGKP